MNRKKLLRLKTPVLPPAMRTAALHEEPAEKKTYGKRTYCIYKTHCYLAASVEEEILKVGMFTRQDVVSGKNTPRYIIYLSGKENDFITYDVSEDKWRTAKIDCLNIDMGNNAASIYPRVNRQTDSDRRLVNEYFKTGNNREIGAAVLDFQFAIRKSSLLKKHKSEQQQIDIVMNEVQKLPKDFDIWIKNKGFINHEYLFYKKEKPYRLAECLCTHCGRWSEALEKPEHNKETKCPLCKTKVTYKSWNRQQTVEDKEWIGILQKLKDGTGYILRSFTCRITRCWDRGWNNYELKKWEDIRVRLDHNFAAAEYFEYGEWKYTGITRWCHTCRRSAYSGWYGSRTFGNAVMYTKNMKRELKGSKIAYCNAAKYFAPDKGERKNPQSILSTLGRYPMIEFLEKGGYHKIVEEIMDGRMRSSVIDQNAATLKEALKIDRQRMERLKRLSGGWKMLKALQYEQSCGCRLSDEQLSCIESENIDIEELEHERVQMSLPRMISYIRRQAQINGRTFAEMQRYYRDYIDMAQERGMDITDEIVCHNSRIMEYHNRYLEEKNKQKNQKRDREVNKKFARICTDHKINQKHFGYEDEKYIIKAPGRASDITREGRLQHHCVGASDSYMKKMAERESFILFLRRKDMADMPYYTLEAEWGGKIIQAYAAYDRKPDWEEVNKILCKWSEEIKKRLKKENQENNTAAPAHPAMAAG